MASRSEPEGTMERWAAPRRFLPARSGLFWISERTPSAMEGADAGAVVAVVSGALEESVISSAEPRVYLSFKDLMLKMPIKSLFS